MAAYYRYGARKHAFLCGEIFIVLMTARI